MQSKKKIIEYFLIFLLISYALYLCLINNYGWDWDTYAMLDTFLNYKITEFTQNPEEQVILSRIGIGFWLTILEVLQLI